MTRLLGTLLCFALFAAAPHAQERRLAPTETGTIGTFRFTATSSSIRESRATSADVKAGEAAARRLADVIAGVPALNPPIGFHTALIGVLVGPDVTQVKMRPRMPLDLWVRFGAPQMHGDEMNFLHFYINDLRPVILDHMGLRHWEDDRGDMYLEPAATGSVGGFPMYNDLLVIARPGDSIWAPVPAGRLAKAAGLELPAGVDAAVPACVTGGDNPDRSRMKIVPAGAAGCRRVVEANLALFKPELPRSAIQLITVENIDWCRRELASRKEKTVGDCAANLDVVRQLDWQRVAALLEPSTS